MRILLVGKNGQVGWELQRALAPLGELLALGREETGDLATTDRLVARIRELAPQVIVNAAAYTAVDKAETEVEQAQRLNAELPAVLAREAAALDAWLVHYSTDYVFDGSGTQPWTEEAPTGPLSAYGRGKLAGEKAILASGVRALIFRTSWVYASRGHNFVRTVLRLAQERETLDIVADQVGAPTGADLLADVTALALHQVLQADAAGAALSGIYHLVAAGETSWHSIARFVLSEAERAGMQLRVTADKLGAIPSEAYPTPAPRPRNSRLVTSKLEQAFNVRMPPWQSGIQRMLHEILAK